MTTSKILVTKSTADYALLDSGDGEKLERFGKVVLSRPDPQALWTKKLSPAEWKKVDGHFVHEESGGKWSLKSGLPAKWAVSFSGLKFWIKLTAFKHTGLFPEQATNWGWVKKQIEEWKRGKSAQENKVSRDTPSTSGEVAAGSRSLSLAPKRPSNPLFFADSQIEVLNLFGYTGGATLACAQAGAKVVHIDSSKTAVAWARENAEISGLTDKPIRWIVEDARVFVEREIKRGRKYDAVIMDPPAFGHGADDELWKIEEHFLPLVGNCFKLLSDKPLFFLINGYSAGYSALSYQNVLLPLMEKFSGEIEVGELTIEEEGTNTEVRLLPAGIFARWFLK
ncbi:MAG: hypothetical protein A2830_00300 [Candidatus Taylorbacteria bacterium RIFCSPHIGHO2_01_FULL_44_110]|uniref:Uncharacterized protein n=1 Tax=Candidatus Taylorbacteria bacterium RIFCSPHIGHO2_12_FULL_45_16 TaxID=1802315 RepID=A0A1G2N0I0_9BACT|nr:MAG: hypothetical protein A2830_00300 [Candidatus Taylorbacteria bacterium RIFCSPHIGHO2_01_FULL_44_110]OHA28832.1 MAG: hypothetical protein A3F51_02525 [Candidatus Taylorbacteria bacterium RIFCSPHIGHO2_12_FULL_45_16]OHA32891.1 MAG: hypothetical protein A3A23_03325 [Candidatus Taylorbacteria bacterium RIFCSPLOWO2_01_FULL_45_59]OHA38613.1 MAG: hypothetical protein A3I98_01100 [Candidatus Taylorbacteria bacterium RIFCSPLOWO2_02_FULL_45_10b]OHA43606.1 MAG: hypothetical protein A3G04_03920 [Candi